MAMPSRKVHRGRRGSRPRAGAEGARVVAGRIEPRLAELEGRLGYTFTDRAVLVEAVTHSTFANEVPEAGPPYERLEFLGDAVVDLLAADILLAKMVDANEGVLTGWRARVVSRDALAAQARALGLGAFLRLGRGEQAGAGRGSILADAFEALVGAVFRDGGYDEVKRVFGPMLERAVGEADGAIDFKTRFQEACHRRGLAPPVYRVEAVDGPDHARQYACVVELDGRVVGRGSASSKRAAEQGCAAEALAAITAERGG